jgi:membrane-bound lytic murein transglycosylase D
VPVLLIPFFLAGMVEAVDEAKVPAPVDLVVPSIVAALPLHQNERVERWAERFRTSQRPAFQRLLYRMGAYEELIRGKLRQRNMPEELLYLSMMEGGFKPRARSSASAVGLWQFMGPTAQQYGLRVDEWVDERRDPVRSTDAALEYLSWLQERYGSWYLAAAAYNAGPGRIDRVLRRHAAGRTGDEAIYWEILEHLPLETREYVPRLVAATLVAEGAEAEGFDMELVQPYRYDRVFVPGATSLSRVARIIGVETGTLRALNPHLVRGITPPDQAYPVRVPVGDSPRVVASVKGRSRGHVLD